MECLNPETHCHDKKNVCMPFIVDCEEHYKKCSDGCHEECACQDFDGPPEQEGE